MKVKCREKNCKEQVELPYRYCSIECACYDGYYKKVSGRLIIDPVKVKELEKEAKQLNGKS